MRQRNERNLFAANCMPICISHLLLRYIFMLLNCLKFLYLRCLNILDYRACD